MKSLASTLGKLRNISETHSDDDHDPRMCRRCGQWLATDEYPDREIHECCACGDARFVRRPGTGDLRSPDFGKSDPCGKCTAIDGSETADGVLNRGRVPIKFRQKRIEDWLPADGGPRLRVEDWIAEWPVRKPLLFLMGDKGAGKTHLACGILRRAYERYRIRGQFWSVIDLLDRYRATFDRDTATETVAQIDEELRRSPLLVLDDYGAENETDYASERVFRLVDERYREHKPLVVTTNVSVLALNERIRRRFRDGETAQGVMFGVAS